MKRAEWERYRNWTLANCSLGAFSFGLSLTIYYPTEYYYFKDTMKVSAPSLFYGLSWAFLCGSGIISSFVGSYYADMTKDVRRIFLWSNTLNVVGNLMYLLYYSPYVVLVGQFLIGTAAARMVAGVGEISRIYDADELTSKVAFLGIFTTIGSIIGPSTTFLFNLVDTRIGNWILNINNVVGIVMGGLYLLQFWVHYFSLKNLSKEYNLKRDVTQALLLKTKVGEESMDESESSDEKMPSKEILEDKTPLMDQRQTQLLSQEEKDKTAGVQEKYVIALRTLLRNREVLFLYVLSFFCSYCRATIILLSPIKSFYYLGWMQTKLAMLNIISTFAGAIPTALAFSLLSKSVNDAYLLALTVITLLIALFFMAIIPIIHDNITMITVLLYCNGILTLMSTSGFHIMSRSMLAQYVPENVQTVTEAIRNSLFELSYLTAGLCIKLPDVYMTEFMFAASFLTTLALAWLLVKADKFKDIQVIQVDM